MVPLTYIIPVIAYLSTRKDMSMVSHVSVLLVAQYSVLCSLRSRLLALCMILSLGPVLDPWLRNSRTVRGDLRGWNMSFVHMQYFHRTCHSLDYV